MPPASVSALRKRSAPSQAVSARNDAHSPAEVRKDQKVVLITGAASGMGRELTIQLARRGWRVAGLDQNAGDLEKLQKELAIDDFSWGAADVTDAAALEMEVAKLTSELGRVDLL